MTPARPRPNVDEDNKPFWDAVGARRFVLMCCKTCGASYWPASYCRNHPGEPFMEGLEWREASGRGKVFTFNIHRQAFHPAFSVPYVFALIVLDEGPMFGTNIVGCDPEEVRVGMPVSVCFEEVEEGVVLPLFQPSERRETKR